MIQRFLSLVALLLLVACQAPRMDPGDGPHIIIVTIDALRPDHTTVYGYERDTTPNLSELAHHSVIFDNAYTVDTRTGPAHATIFTGLYPQALGAARTYRMRESARTLAQVFQDRGYRTGGFVSGYPLPRRFMNLERGFDVYEDSVDQATGTRIASQTLEHARVWLAGNTEHLPTFLFLQFQDPTSPYAAPNTYGLRYLPEGQDDYHAPLQPQRERLASGGANPGEVDEYISRYDGEVAYVDAMLGKLWRMLREYGYWDNTLMIVVGTQGETLNERPWMFSHGHRANEEQLRIPFLLRLPGDDQIGKRVRTPTDHTDIFPTVMDFMGLRPAEELPGRSVLPSIQFEEPDSTARVGMSLAGPKPEAVPEVKGRVATRGVVASIRQHPWKLISYPLRGGNEAFLLYNLKDDPQELKNVYEQYEPVATQLAERMDVWWKAEEYKPQEGLQANPANNRAPARPKVPTPSAPTAPQEPAPTENE